MKRLDNPRKHFFKENINLFAGGGNVFSKKKKEFTETGYLIPEIDNIIKEYIQPHPFEKIKEMYKRSDLELALASLENKIIKTKQDEEAIDYIHRMLNIVK